MGKFCQVCGKGLMTGHNVSHSNRKTNRTWAPNVQKVRINCGSRVMTVNVCTRCLRSGYVRKSQTRLARDGFFLKHARRMRHAVICIKRQKGNACYDDFFCRNVSGRKLCGAAG